MVALVLFSRPLTKVKRYWAAMCTSVGFWSIGFSWMCSTNNPSSALTASQIVNGSAIFIPTFLLHTVQALLNSDKNKILITMYLSSIFLFLVTITGNLVYVRPIFEFSFYTAPKHVYFLFLIHLYGGFVIVEWLLYKAAINAPRLVKKQFMLLFWGAGLGFLGGQMTIFPVYEINIFPYGSFFVPVYIVIVGYGMLKYQFMDFRLAVRKFSLTLMIYFFLFLLLAPITWHFFKIIKNYPSSIIVDILILSTTLTLLIGSGPIIYAFCSHYTYWLRGHTTMALAHELKSPLSNIRGAADLLSTKLPQSPLQDSPTESYLQILQTNTDRLEKFIENLLNVASIKEGSYTLTLTEFSLIKIVNATREHFLPIANRKGIKIINDITDDVAIYGDEEKISQVFSNLISNAIKYSDSGIITVNALIQEPNVTCSITDEGQGIDPKKIDRIFDLFYQASESTKGSGIGLAIAKAWVNAHNGKIWAESAGIKKGAKIAFTIPLA